MAYGRNGKCVGDYDCPGDYYCYTGTWECRRKGYAYSSCREDKECSYGYVCTKGKCAFPTKKYECYGDLDCGSHIKYCSTVDWKCHFKGNEGDSCTYSSDCLDDMTCVDSVCEPDSSSSFLGGGHSSTTESGSSFAVVALIVMLILFLMLGIAFVVVKGLRKKDPATETNVPQ